MQVLVATDIMARGIDVEDITHVINYELPEDPENYVHRIGRTARAGKAGVALSLCDLEEVSLLRNVERFTRMPIRVIEDHPFHSVGVAACRDAAARVAKSKSRAGSARGSGSKWSRWGIEYVERQGPPGGPFSIIPPSHPDSWPPIIATPALAPNRVAPARTRASAWARVLIPPEALTPRPASRTAAAMSAT